MTTAIVKPTGVGFTTGFSFRGRVGRFVLARVLCMRCGRSLEGQSATATTCVCAVSPATPAEGAWTR